LKVYHINFLDKYLIYNKTLYLPVVFMASYYNNIVYSVLEYMTGLLQCIT